MGNEASAPTHTQRSAVTQPSGDDKTTFSEKAGTPMPERVLKRGPKETDFMYEQRWIRFVEITRTLAYVDCDSKWQELPEDLYQAYGRRIYGLTSETLPLYEWDRLRCIAWINCFLWERLAFPLQRVNELACKFVGCGSLLVRMDKKDWVALYPYGVGHSLWAWIEDLKEKAAAARVVEAAIKVSKVVEGEICEGADGGSKSDPSKDIGPQAEKEPKRWCDYIDVAKEVAGIENDTSISVEKQQGESRRDEEDDLLVDLN